MSQNTGLNVLTRLIRFFTFMAVLGGALLVAGIVIGVFLRHSLSHTAWGIATSVCILAGLSNLVVGLWARRRGQQSLARVHQSQVGA